MAWKTLTMAAVACGLAAGVTASATSAQSGAETLTFKGDANAFTFIDVRPRGESAGDTFIFGRRLTADGKAAGRAQFVCVEADTHRHAQQCSGTLQLRAGQLAVQGAVEGDTKRAQFAITGGTGVYVGRRGSLTTIMGPKDRSTLIVRLLG